MPSGARTSGSHSHLDLPLHRRHPAGGGLPRRARAARRRRRARALAGRRTGPQHRRAGRREPRLEARPGGSGSAPPTCWTPTTPSATRLPPACCYTMAQAPSSAATSAPTPCATRSPSCSTSTTHASAWPGCLRPRHPLRPRRHPPAGRTRMPDLDLATDEWPCARVHAAARRASGAPQPRRTGRFRTSLRGPTASSWSMPPTTARGSFRCSARSPRPRRCSSGPTAMWPGWGRARTRARRRAHHLVRAGLGLAVGKTFPSSILPSPSDR